MLLDIDAPSDVTAKLLCCLFHTGNVLKQHPVKDVLCFVPYREAFPVASIITKVQKNILLQTKFKFKLVWIPCRPKKYQEHKFKWHQVLSKSEVPSQFSPGSEIPSPKPTKMPRWKRDQSYRPDSIVVRSGCRMESMSLWNKLSTDSVAVKSPVISGHCWSVRICRLV